MPNRRCLPLSLFRFLSLLCTVVLWWCLSVTASVHAATFTVDRIDDETTATTCDDATPNDCSLRGAILAANARPISEASTINVPAGTYVLSQMSSCTFSVQPDPTEFFTSSHIPLCLSKQVTIQGAGAATTIIDGGQRVRVLYVSASAVAELRGVTIANGLGDPSFGSPRLVALPLSGGGILNEGTLTLTDSVVSNNSLDPSAGAAGGAGIYNVGVLTLLRSRVSDNISPSNDLGGGILNSQQATLTVNDSTISNNTIGANGGGICNVNGAVTITDSTVSGNTANGFSGGGIANFGGNFDGTLTVINSTISGNTSRSEGAGIFNGARTIVHLNNVTITSNATGDIAGGASGGVASRGTFTLQNTVIAGNTDTFHPDGSDCTTGTTLISQGHNLLQNTGGCIITGDTTGNILGQDARLGLLRDNGGFTKTHALSDGSPAIDAGNPAAPGSGGFACTALDQRGIPRPQGVVCDIGAFERSTAFSLAKVLPNTGGNTGSVSAFVVGNGFVNGATVKLTRAGQADIIGTPVQVDGGGSALATTFDLTGKSLGVWDVVVTNPDGTSKTLTGSFAIEEGRAPQLWADVIGGNRVRGGRPARFTILFGNRGNIDAVGVPLVLGVPRDFAFGLSVSFAPPPPQAGQVPTDWNVAAFNGISQEHPDFTMMPLFLPVVPAGFTGVLELTITAPLESVGRSFEILFGIKSPYFTPTLDAQLVDELTDAARAYAEQHLDATIPPELIPDLKRYLTTQLQSEVTRGREALIASVGTDLKIYSLSHLLLDVAQFGAAQGNFQTSQEQSQTKRWLAPLVRLLTTVLTPNEVYATCKEDGGKWVTCSGCAQPTCCVGLQSTCCFSFSCPKPPPPPCSGSSCTPGPGGGGAGGSIVGSLDPNDKAGSRGAGTAQYLTGDQPLRYTILFENVETASAPAQEVVITDQLDSSKVDFDTFSLGPISFGDKTVVPPPGLSQYSTSVDLRPAQTLLVGIDARLNKSTGLITWRFTSIDPLTGQFTEDPLAGFLPPNVNPPEGDGSVVFTIRSKVTGIPICNQASIVFDVNAPIVTPQWCNTIDATSPSSAVQSLSATQVTTDFPVQWAGSDTGAGIADYTIFVSENGGSFTEFVTNTTDISAMFTGVAGNTYAFYSIARDLVGNVEAVPAQPDTITRVTGPVVELCGNCLDDDSDGKTDWLDSDCEAAALTVKKGVLNTAKPVPGDEKIALVGSFAPATIAPPAEGVTLSFIQPGTGTEDPDVVLACVQIPPGASGWTTARNGKKWTFKDRRGGLLGDPESKDALAIKYNAKKQRYDLVGAIAEAEVGALTAGEVSTQLSIGGQGWEKTQGWKLKAKGKQLVTP